MRRELADLPPLELFERHGKPVEEAGFPSLEAAVEARGWKSETLYDP